MYLSTSYMINQLRECDTLLSNKFPTNIFSENLNMQIRVFSLSETQ